MEIDSALSVRADRGLQVRYVAASEPVRGRVTDELYLNDRAGERAWQAGQTISEFAVTVRCTPESP